MTQTTTWWHRPWVAGFENIAAHVVAVVVGLVMMIVGLGLGVTMIMLPVGIVVGLTGAALFVAGLLGREHVS